MTPPPETRKFVEANKRSKGSKVWIALSFTLSALVLGWAFSLPFRQTGTPIVSSATGDDPNQPFRRLEQIRERRSNAEEFREAAIALNEEFMRSIRKKREAEKRDRPGIQESKEHWQRHVTLVHKQLKELDDAEEGSLAWAYRQSLEESLEDGPR